MNEGGYRPRTFPGSNARCLFRSISAATIGFLVAAAAALAQQTYSVLKTFQSQGDHPWAGVIQASDGFYYGTTFSGGPAGQGTIYRVAADGAFSTLHVFTGADGGHPRARLLQGSDGRLYGTTWGGGSGDGGTIFQISPDGTGFAVVHAFAPILGEGSAPYAEVFEALDGDLYGTTNQGGANGVGTIFRLDLESSELTTLHSFDTADGASPYGGVVQGSDGHLYGVTPSGGVHEKGTIFRLETDGELFATVHEFDGTDGFGASASLLAGNDGAFYGIAEGGGTADHGTVFRFDPSSLVLATVHAFGIGEGELPRGNLCQGLDGSLYGTTFLGPPTYRGSVFRVDTDGANFQTLKTLTGESGAHPYGGVIQGADGALYGTTDDTGNNLSQYGTVFRVAADGSTFETIHSFQPFVEGESPQAEVILASDGALYGTTSEGGLHGFGTIFRMTPQGADFTVLHDFAFADGARPFARLIEGPGGMLYATTQSGGDDGSGRGTVFKFDPVTAELTELHAFHDDDGRSPTGGVVLGADGFLYGTTESGGANQNFGTVFRIGTDGSDFETLHDFAGPDGQSPRGGVLLAGDGRLYGLTAFGGAGGRGTLFGLDADGENFGALHDFDATDGGQARSRLTQGAGTLLYGTTWVGGTNDAGTVFRFDTSGPLLTTLRSFQIAEGAGPSAALLVGADGLLYGTTDIGGAANGGTLFRIDVDGSDFETVHPFSTATGAGPHGGVFQGADATLYGTTAFGGLDDGGVVFRLAFCALTPPAVTPSGPTELCQAESVTLSAPPGFATYLWSPGGETTASILVEQAGSYAVAVADAQGCGAVSAPTVVTVSPYPSPEIETGLCVPPDTSGLTAAVAAQGTDYAWTIVGGTIDSGQGSSAIQFTSGAPGTAMMLSLVETSAAGCAAEAEIVVQADFADVPPGDPFHPYVCAIGRAGITAGCGSGAYCRNDAVTRDQMAVFLLKAKHGSDFEPPPCKGVFPDVACPSAFADWIEELFLEGITGGCGNGNYCPDSPVRRDQMAAFLLKADHGSTYVPPACVGIFADVPCGGTFSAWIEELFAEGVTAGCADGLYCPTSPNTRGQMAVFLAKAFGLD